MEDTKITITLWLELEDKDGGRVSFKENMDSIGKAEEVLGRFERRIADYRRLIALKDDEPSN